MISGTLLTEKAAPGVCSVFISLGSFLGGIFFDAEGTGGVIYKICKCLPFIYCTKAARSAIKLEFTWKNFGQPMVIVSAVAIVLVVAAILVFSGKMKADK